MKNFFLVFCFLLLINLTKAQCIRIFVSETIKGVEIPIARREFEVYVNDTLKKKVQSDASGFLTRLSLERGKYDVKIKNPEYNCAPMNGVVVEESKSTEITMIVSISANAVPEKKK